MVFPVILVSRGLEGTQAKTVATERPEIWAQLGLQEQMGSMD